VHGIFGIKAATIVMVALCVTACATLGIVPTATQEFEKGLGLFHQGRYIEAILHFQRATELDPEFARAYLYLGRCHVNVRQWPQAIPPLRTALRLSPDEFKKEAVQILLDALVGLAMAQFRQGDSDDAGAAVAHGLNLDHQSPELRQRIADFLVSSGERSIEGGCTDDVMACSSQATEHAPNDAAPYISLAKTLIAQGNFSGALRVLCRALNLDPDDPHIQQLLKASAR